MLLQRRSSGKCCAAAEEEGDRCSADGGCGARGDVPPPDAGRICSASRGDDGSAVAADAMAETGGVPRASSLDPPAPPPLSGVVVCAGAAGRAGGDKSW